MSEANDGYEVKRCAKCAAWIPTSATACSYCGTTSPDEPLARPTGPILSLRHGVSATNALIVANLTFFVFSIAAAKARGVEGNALLWTLTGGGGFGVGIWRAGAYWHPSVFHDGQWWRVISAAFLHYGAIHIGLNMLALRDVGRVAEEIFGTAKFLVVYLLSGVGSTLAISLWFHQIRPGGVEPLMAGASGAIFGVMGLVAVYLLRAGTDAGRAIGKKLARDVVYMLAIGFLVPFISNTGHVGGLAVGAACGFVVHGRFAVRFNAARRALWTRLAATLVVVAGAALLAAAWFATTYKGEISMKARGLAVVALVVAGCASRPPAWKAFPDDPAEPHLRNVRQLTFGGENAEAYWSWDGSKLILQVAHRMGFECDQITMMNADGSGERLVSTGRGRTTCSYFLPDDERIIYASTHLAGDECPTKAQADPGVYAWPVFASYDIFKADATGKRMTRLTDTPGYDAEGTIGPDGTIVFTSQRDGDLDIYSMDADGRNVKRLTTALGYDGGPFISLDGKKIVYRSHHPTAPADVEKYKALLAKGLVQPTKMDLWIMDADGSNQRQITHLAGASFGPFLRRAGERIIFSSNYEQPRGPEFDLYLVNEDGSDLEPVTRHAGFDGFPMFSPDGTQLVWCSARGGTDPHELNVFLADWVK